MVQEIGTLFRVLSTQLVCLAVLMSVIGMSGCSSEEEKTGEPEMSREELAKQYRQQSEGLLKVKQPKPTSEPK